MPTSTDTTATAPDLIAEAITDYFGERCDDFATDCVCCQVWARYDALTRTTATAAPDEAVRAGADAIRALWKASRQGVITAPQLARAALTAAPPHIRQAAEPVAIKALEWEKLANQHGTQHRARGIFGWLHYISDRDPDGGFFGTWHSILGDFYTLDAAKAAAQADYETRIRSALVTSPAQQEPVAVPAGWRLVPEEPTGDQHDAARDWSAEKYGKPIGTDASHGCYRAMLAAAPASPAPDMREVADALEFYGSKERWEEFEDDARASVYDRNVGSELGRDSGQMAREALARLHTRGDASHG